MKLMKSRINLELEVNLEKFSKENLIFTGKLQLRTKMLKDVKKKLFYTLRLLVFYAAR